MAATHGSSTPEPESQRRGPFGRIVLFLRQVVDELRKVVTPTSEELIRMTGVVLAFVAVMILLVMGLDWVFGTLAGLLFGAGPA
ncbi:preprotein translocase subunit SecE [Micrococcus flavus]|uniref:Protein translocase subunit SecE n=1 Tax=Micrococcus flavus TaxID=384602 RepID=A0A4Y8X3T1_9MICC|nr:preprotein translocase subunit SecE [Micrococcus flavus]MBB4882130.1 preprotein translocase subunit SecE [Micrococcus flavus]TFI03942.1 preprotein translocase subunit SecE [Micrococcus flavus]